MDRKTLHSRTWNLVRCQHGVVSRPQLLELGWTGDEVEARLKNARLHRLFRGVYAVGRPQVDQNGWWMAAVLASGKGAALSHWDGAGLYEIIERVRRPIDVSVPLSARRSQRGIEMHPRVLLPHEITEHHGIPVTTVPVVLTDLAATIRRGPLEGLINRADILGHTTPPDLRAALDEMPQRAGRKPLRETLDRATFRFTRSELERAFIPIALSAGLPRPETCVEVNGWEVDFYWPELDFVVETDSLTYHRTPQQQAVDRLRDHAHTNAETEWLRFTHSQIKYEPAYVRALLVKVARRLLGEVRREPQELGHR
jgi:very-short-patch-repair endonuclease